MVKSLAIYNSLLVAGMLIVEYLKTFRDALGFLSLAPVGRPGPLTPAQLGRFPAFYPLVGLVLGAGLFLVWTAAAFCLPPDIAALAAVVFLTAATRGFHLDGLADTADALFSHQPRDRKLAILKDSRQGTFGVLAIVLAVTIKIQLLAHLAPAAPWALILWPAWGRLGASAVAVLSPYVGGETGLGRFMVENSTPRELGLAALFTFGPSLFCGPEAGAAALAAALSGFLLVPVWNRTLGGVTGDLLGASLELAEIFSLGFFYLLTTV